MVFFINKVFNSIFIFLIFLLWYIDAYRGIMHLGIFCNKCLGETEMKQICNESKYYKSHQLCQMLGISPLTLRNWVALKKVPKPVRIGTTIFFEKEVFDSFLKEGGMPR